MARNRRTLALPVTIAAFLAGFALTGCEEEGVAENAGKAIDQAAEQTGQAIEQTAEQVGEAVKEMEEKTEESSQ